MKYKNLTVKMGCGALDRSLWFYSDQRTDGGDDELFCFGSAPILFRNLWIFARSSLPALLNAGACVS
jgi:hypothetical protein